MESRWLFLFNATNKHKNLLTNKHGRKPYLVCEVIIRCSELWQMTNQYPLDVTTELLNATLVWSISPSIMCAKWHHIRAHDLKEWNVFEVKTFVAHVKMHLAFKALHEESSCALYCNISTTHFQMLVGSCDPDQHRCVLRLKQPRSRGQRWEPGQYQNHWRQYHIAIIRIGQSLWRSESSAAIVAFSPGTLKMEKNTILKQNSTTLKSYFIKKRFQKDFIHLITKVGPKSPPSLMLSFQSQLTALSTSQSLG